MKGIVADIQGKYAVVLSKDGSFIKVRNNGLYSIGCEIDIVRAGINTRMLARVSSMAAGALLVMGVSYGAYSYTVPYSFVDIDINPSIEITTNIYDRIIKTEGLNEDGRKLLLAGSLKHSRLDEGITIILNNAVQQGYIKEETTENAVIFTVVSKDAKRSEKLQKGLETIAAAEFKEEGVKSDLVIDKASKQEHDSAREAGLTPGKYNLIEKAIEAVPGLKLEDLKDATVKDIMKKIKENKKEEKQEDKQNKQEDRQDKQDDKKVDKQEDKEVGQDKQQGKQEDKQVSRQEDKQDSRDGQEDKQAGRQEDKQDKHEDKQQDKQDKGQDVKKNDSNSDSVNNSDDKPVNNPGHTGKDNGKNDAVTEESGTGSGNSATNDQGGKDNEDTADDKGKPDNKKP